MSVFRRLFRVLLPLATITALQMSSHGAQAQVAPNSLEQFYAKQWTEGLGRIPDQPTWNGLMQAGLAQGCNPGFISAVSSLVYNSDEFWNDYQINGQPDYGAMVIAMFRGVLNMEADQGSYDNYVALLQSSGSPRATWQDILNYVMTTPTFYAIAGVVCQQAPYGSPSYFWNPSAITSRVPSNPPGITCQIASEADLRACIDGNQGQTILLSPDLVVTIMGPPIMLQNHTSLATLGFPGPNQYASMARLVRGTNTSGQALVEVYPNSFLQSVWVDGNRSNLALGQSTGCPNQTCGCPATSDSSSPTYSATAPTPNHCDNIWLMGGNPANVTSNVQSVRSTDSDGESSIFALGAIGTSGACVGQVFIANNLVTQYATSHIAWDAGHSYFSDGISIECGNTVVVSNSVVDASDVAIDLFGPLAYDGVGPTPTPAPAPGAPYVGSQSSFVQGNQILNAGNGAFGGIVAESRVSDNTNVVPTYGCQGGQQQTSFAGAVIDSNTLWTGANGHMAIALSLGVRPWYPNALTGTGVVASNNTSGISTLYATVGIAISGMCNAQVINNGMALNVQAYPDNTCTPSGITYSPGYGIGATIVFNNQSFSNFYYSEISACVQDVPL